MMPPAGTSKRGVGGSTQDCLTFEERPRTPPEISKYRRSTNLEPGKRFVHHGMADDLDTLQLEQKNFGISSERGRNTAAELINLPKPSEVQRINIIKSEKIYKSATKEALGRTVDRQMVLPSKFAEGLPFGITSSSSAEPAKAVIFPGLNEDSVKGEDLYIRSHGSYGPGEQKRRNYDWPVDPNQTRFGAKGDIIAFNGVSKNVADILRNADENVSMVNAKRVEDFRNMGDILATTRNLGQGSGSRPPDTIYGKPSVKKGKHWTASEIIGGRYLPQDQLPDADLGKSITPGFRNIALEDRAYGCPSIRTDLPSGPRGRRSLADSQNYGDDVPARDLVNPPAFSDMAIAPTAMSEPRSKDKLVSLFTRIGHVVDPRVFDAVFDEASQGGDMASINDFRTSLNDFLFAQDEGCAEEWLAQRLGPRY